ncbi:MAG: hypothetical protein AAGD11_03700 [Planctomycetota bacterium]
MKTDDDKKSVVKFGIRDLALIILGISVLLGSLTWIAQGIDLELRTFFILFYSIPIVSGMGGLLIGHFRGGIIGAIGGAIVLATLIAVLR